MHPNHDSILASAAFQIEQSRRVLLQVHDFDDGANVIDQYLRVVTGAVTVMAQADSAITNATASIGVVEPVR